MSETFVWSKVFETGFARIDEQHRYLVGLINEASPLLADQNPVPLEAILPLIERMAQYAVFHFGEEKRLMEEKKLAPDFVAFHLRQHGEFAADVQALRQDALDVDGQPFDRIGLLRYLISWLAYHILGTDQLMAEQIRRVDAGERPADAYRHAGEPQDSAVVPPLLEALTGLHQVISSRNRSLREINQTLRTTQSELQRANRELEERVANRTRQLEGEKSELSAIVAKLELSQEQLLQSEKMAAIGQLAAGVAHEINNPVGFVNSNLGSLKKYVEQLLRLVEVSESMAEVLPAGDARRQQFERVRQEVDLDFLKQDIGDLLEESESGLGRVKKIVQNLKDFSHADDGEWREADLNAGLDSTLTMVSNEIKYKAEVIKQYGELPPVTCIAAQLNQVFMNLLVNAAQAIDGHGLIVVRTGSTDQTAWVEIADNGAGMSEAVQHRIFEPFFTTKPVGKGTGLGLSISWEIVVKKHGGALTVESAPGQGTTFRIELPLKHDPAPPTLTA